MGELLDSLLRVFGTKFTLEKAGLFKSGQQTDSLSCSLFAMNAIRHDVLKEPLLDQGGAQAE